MLLSIALIVLSIIILSTWLNVRWKLKSRGLRLPPGPPSLPIIGHLLSMPRSRQEIAFREWSKTYGDVIYLHLFGKPIVILSSVKAATDLLEKRSSIYSGRPKLPVYELMGWELNLTLLDYGKQFQLHRRMLHQHLNRGKCTDYQQVQTQQAHCLVRKLAQNSDDLHESLERFATGNVIRAAYGHDMVSNDDWYYNIAHDASAALFEAGPPGATPIDLFPFLQYFPSWFPGTYYANLARAKRHLVRRLHEEPVHRIQEQMKEGKAVPSFVLSQLEQMEYEGDKIKPTVNDIQGAAAVMHAAGTDTTWMTLSLFLLALVHYPECQKKAQEEIDALIGPGGLPEFSDRESLRYVECIWQETLRWHQIIPLGLPHVLSEDDVYDGMFIPKGTAVFANVRAMTLDEDVYHEPSEFRPERYLPKPAGNGEPFPPVFGWGRRVCPGRHFGDASLWIAIATILATLTISKATKEDGKEITPEIKFTSALVKYVRIFFRRPDI